LTIFVLLIVTFVLRTQLELEKVYHPFYLLSKKRYAGLKFDSPESAGSLSTSGLELVRRDNAPCLPKIQKAFLNTLIVDADPDRAMRDYHEAIRGLGKLSLEQFTLTKKLAKSEYATPQIHAELNAKLARREECESYKVGDRIPYVVVVGKGKLYERGECPKYMEKLSERLQCPARIDVDWYRARIMDAMDRLLAPLWGTKNLVLFNERMLQPQINPITKTPNAPWFPALLAAGAAKAAPEQKKKRKANGDPDEKQRSIKSFFKKKE
jgi:DNA polymerase delta subunit 1